ncbi:MAG: D-glycero-beta-D-manno-heptose 1,7-bisphosphate 7-phosphatase [Rhodanobacter sp.]
MAMAVKHVILDRDGVLNVESSTGGYVRDWSQWRWTAGALEGLEMLSAAGVRVSVATNQAGVGRGMVEQADLDAIHAQMIAEAAHAGGTISQVFVCPHVPESGCDCRKPAPGLLLQAIEVSGIPRQATLMVGDASRDLEAAWAADVSSVLVRTGKGRLTEAEVAVRGVPVFDDLRAFAASVHSILRVSDPP